MPGAVSPKASSAPRGGGDRFNVVLTFPGHANRREGIAKLLQRSDAVGGVDLNTGSAVALAVATTTRRDEDYFEPQGSFPKRLQVVRAGVYRITYQVVAQLSGSTDASVLTYVRKNGSGGGIVGSLAAIACTKNAALGCASAVCLSTLVAGDYLELIATRAGSGVASLITYPGGVMVEVELVSGSTDARIGGRHVFDRAAVLEKVTLVKGVSGFSGTTYCRLKKNGSSIMGSNDLAITSAQDFAEFPAWWFSTTAFDVDDTLSVDVTGVESPYPRDLRVICRMANVNG